MRRTDTHPRRPQAARATADPDLPELRPARGGWPAIEIHRSARRRRSSSAALQGDRVVVRVPAGLGSAEEQRIVDLLVRRATGRARAAAIGGDAALRRRADRLADTYLDGVRATSVAWSSRMRRRHGSCEPSEGAIRISAALATHPAYVLDGVLVHELAHLQHPDHSPAFWALVDRYPQAQRARGYLEGFAAGELAGATPAQPVGRAEGQVEGPPSEGPPSEGPPSEGPPSAGSPSEGSPS